jgi:hypothetical protein
MEGLDRLSVFCTKDIGDLSVVRGSFAIILVSVLEFLAVLFCRNRDFFSRILISSPPSEELLSLLAVHSLCVSLRFTALNCLTLLLKQKSFLSL